jgi:microcin C transport system substrate-binding protein
MNNYLAHITLIFMLFSPPLWAAPEQLPTNLKWITNNDDPSWASPKAIKGGTYRMVMANFPLTLRTVGPDSNTGLRSAINGNQMSLVGTHPQTNKPIPELATHWAYDQDGVTTYYKLDPNARWSDGLKVTADDYLFAVEFMRSKHIVAPWYNDWYTNGIVEAKKYDDYTIAITGSAPKSPEDMHYYYGFQPKAKHFYTMDENWVRDYNWKIAPNTGAYQVSKIRKGKYLRFERKKNWWAKDYKYNVNRFNVDKVHYKVIRDNNIAYRHFLRGELDVFGATLPNFWHDKMQGGLYQEGYINKIWFYNETPQPSIGFSLNQTHPLLADKNIRLGFAHSLNIALMLKTVLRGDYERLTSYADGFGDYSNPDIEPYPFDLTKADELFSQAGFSQRGPDGIRTNDKQRLSFSVTYSQSAHTQRLVVLKQEAKKAGLEIVLQLLDGASAYKNVIEKKHEIAFMGFGGGANPQYWAAWHSDNANKPQTNNITNTADPLMDELTTAYKFGISTEQKQKLSKQILQLIHDNGAFIPMYKVPYVRLAYWKWMKLPAHHGTKRSNTLFEPFNNEYGVHFGAISWIDVAEKQATKDALSDGEVFDPVTIIDATFKVRQ